MSILALQTAAPTGLASVNPEVIYILTSDTYATVTTTGYLTQQAQQGFTFNNQQMALVYTSDDGPAWFKVVITYSGATVLNTVVSLVPAVVPGEVTLPTIINHIIVSTDTVGTLANLTGTAINNGSIQAGKSGTAGTLISFPATGANGSLILAAVNAGGAFNTTISNGTTGQSQVVSIPDSGATTANFIISKFATTQHVTVGALQVDAGVVSSGISTGGTAGGFIAYPATTTNGSLRLTPVGNVGNFAATISNIVGLGQATVYTLPDPGAATANILISASAGGQTISGGLTISSGALGVSAGAITSGLSAGGFVGLVKAFPTTATSGFVALQAAINAGGNFGTTISNAVSQGQAQVVSIPDAGAATANFIIDHGTQAMAAGSQLNLAKVSAAESANAVTASGQAGFITTSSLTAAGGATYAITWTNTHITATSVVMLSIQGGTNTTQNITFECVPGSGAATITIYNNTAATALNGTIIIGYAVF